MQRPVRFDEGFLRYIFSFVWIADKTSDKP
jgi:hypothetical protein